MAIKLQSAVKLSETSRESPNSQRRWEDEFPMKRQIGATGVARYTPSLRGDRFGRQYLHPMDKLTIPELDEMRFDGQIKAGLALLKHPIARAKWTINCRDKDIAAFCQEQIQPIWNRLIRQMLSALEFGHSSSEILWEDEYDFTVTSTQSQIATERDLIYPMCTKIAGTVQLDPMTYWLLAYRKSGDFAGINQFTPYNVIIPRSKCIHWAHDEEYKELYGISAMKPCYEYWFFKRMQYENLNIFYETYSMPIKKGRYPQGVSPMGKDANGKAIEIDNQGHMLGLLEELRNNLAVALPGNRYEDGDKSYMWDIEFMESQRTGADQLAYLEYLDLMILKSLLVPQLALETGSSGTYNLAQEQIDFFMLRIESIMAQIEEVINSQLIRRAVVANFGRKAPQALFKFQPLYKDTMEGLVNVLLETIGTGKPIPCADGSYLQPDWRWVSQQSGIPMEQLTEEQVDALMAADQKLNPVDMGYGSNPDGSPVQPPAGAAPAGGGPGAASKADGGGGQRQAQSDGGDNLSGQSDLKLSEWTLENGEWIWTPKMAA